MQALDLYTNEHGAAGFQGNRLIEARRIHSEPLGAHVWLARNAAEAGALGLLREEGEAVYFLDEDDPVYLKSLSSEQLEKINLMKRSFPGCIIADRQDAQSPPAKQDARREPPKYVPQGGPDPDANFMTPFAKQILEGRAKKIADKE